MAIDLKSFAGVLFLLLGALDLDPVDLKTIVQPRIQASLKPETKTGDALQFPSKVRAVDSVPHSTQDMLNEAVMVVMAGEMPVLVADGLSSKIPRLANRAFSIPKKSRRPKRSSTDEFLVRAASTSIDAVVTIVASEDLNQIEDGVLLRPKKVPYGDCDNKKNILHRCCLGTKSIDSTLNVRINSSNFSFRGEINNGVGFQVKYCRVNPVFDTASERTVFTDTRKTILQELEIGRPVCRGTKFTYKTYKGFYYWSPEHQQPRQRRRNISIETASATDCEYVYSLSLGIHKVVPKG